CCKPMQKTRLLYLPAFDVLSAEATLIDKRSHADGCDLIFDQTVFYPGGGGQPADTGHVVFAGAPLAVAAVRMSDDGIVRHQVAACPASLAVGGTLHLQVDADTRRLHERLHSAGHVIDMAVHQLGFDWAPTKGAHFPAMSFVEYEATQAPADETKARPQAQCDQLVAAGSTNTISFADDSGAVLTHPDLGHMAARRVVAYDGFGIACGGTHVADIAAIGRLLITKTKRKKGIMKVSYTVVPA